MPDKKDRFGLFKNMSTLKKVLIAFVVLLIFIILVEQPGTDDSKRRKSTKFFIPKLVMEEVTKLYIDNPAFAKPVHLERIENKWRIANGHSFPADERLMQDFLKALFSLQQGAIVSKNPERMSIFSIDEVSGVRVRVWNHKENPIADFYAGDSIPKGQYLRRQDSYVVYQTIPTLKPYLSVDNEGWKDKTLISVDEAQIKRVSLKNHEKEITMEKREEDVWQVIQPEDYAADGLAVRTLFDQLVHLKADAFVSSVEGSQADFENPDYKISLRLMDDSIKLVLFSISEDENEYFAKNGETSFIYSVSKEFIDQLFGLEFKPADVES